MSQRILSHVRVIDVSSGLAGPLVGSLLGDLGADVIKVEPPDGGDHLRHASPQWGEWCTYFLSGNRSKRSVALDFKTARGRELLLDMVSDSDVFVHNLRPRKVAEADLEYDTLSSVNTDLVYLSITAYGSDGPASARPGYDAMIQAASGIMDMTGEPDGPPVRTGPGIIDLGTGMWGALSVVSALLHRDREGRGQKIDLNLFETGLFYLTPQVAGVLGGHRMRRMGSANPGAVPYQQFETADGHFFVAVISDDQFRRLCEEMGHPDWARDERFRTNPARVENRHQLEERLREAFRSEPTQHWINLCDRAGVPASPIRSVEEAMDWEQTQVLETLEAIDGHALEDLALPRFPPRFSRTPAGAQKPPPAVGEHTREVLSEFGLSAERIEELMSSEAVSDG